MASIVKSENNISVWILKNDTGLERYLSLHGTVEFISNSVNAITAATQKWEGQSFPYVEQVANNVVCFEEE